MADTKKEYTSNLHPKGDMDTTVYPNVKSENIIDKDTTAYTAGKVPDSSLVSKSLDGISENLETTKIQVATNKKNIQTLQYQVNTNSSDIALTKTQVETNKTNIAKNTQDITALETDNQTTKTTIAELVSDNTQNKKDIATNAQNIENLSAVMPTDINVDANGYAILEHDGTEITGQTKKVKFAQTDKPASFSEVTIPTASDLKTQDGSSFGGDVSLNKVNEFVNGNTVISIIDRVSNPWGSGYYTGIMSKIKGKNYRSSPFIFIGLEENGTNLKPVAIVADSLSSSASKVEFHVGDYSEWGMVINHDGYTRYLSGEIYYLSYHQKFPKKSGTFAMTSDIPNVSNFATKTELNAKQSTLYRHTIEIIKDNEATLILTTESTISTEINTMDKFISAFTGSELACICALNDADAWNIHYIGIQVGTTLNDTSMMSSQDLDTGMTFTDVFGTRGYTMVDKVKPL